INQEAGYVDSLDRFCILPRIPEEIRRLNENNIPAIIVTNQSGIGRGYFSFEFLEELHNKMTLELKKENSRLDGIYICPHTPADRCVCRKPKPGLLLKAAMERGISLHDSYVIGDKITDIQLAHSVGARGILVLTGYGSEAIRTISDDSPDDKPDHVAANLDEAVTWILEEVRRKKQEVRNKNRILIVKPSSLGDIIHSLPVLWALRRSQPDAFIGWVVKDVWKDILTENPLLDEIILLKKGMQGFLSAVNEIRRGRYDTIIDLQGLFRSGILSYLSGGRRRVGFENARESAPLFYNKKISLDNKHIHAVDRYLMTINSTHALPRFPLYINMEDSEWARDFLIKNDLKNVSPLIAINPSARWLKKRWPANLYAALIKRLIQELKAGIIILGSKEDIPVAEEITSTADSKVAIAAGNTSLKTLTALLERVDILITNDSGPMHIAAALGRPVVALFGPTDPVLTGPYGNNHTVIRKDMECSPCFRKACKHGRPLCMESITVDEVIKAVKDMLLKQEV
ncbi:MAG: lipopolysaccharide heptosyltransferase II, partial [Nitrospira sp.]|nr:lipopolysaccharide heptosyltransferase II [Nitrospira sp.]